MYKYKVKIRKSFGEISEEAKLVDNKEFYFIVSSYIIGGHADGEVKMVPVDDSYPDYGPRYLALGDLELID